MLTNLRSYSLILFFLFITGCDLKEPPPTIDSWGPKSVQHGLKFNPQPDGNSAFWVVGKNISKTTVIVFNNEKLVSVVNPNGSEIAAILSDAQKLEVGKYELHLLDLANRLTSNSVYFEVVK